MNNEEQTHTRETISSTHHIYEDTKIEHCFYAIKGFKQEMNDIYLFIILIYKCMNDSESFKHSWAKKTLPKTSEKFSQSEFMSPHLNLNSDFGKAQKVRQPY